MLLKEATMFSKLMPSKHLILYPELSRFLAAHEKQMLELFSENKVQDNKSGGQTIISGIPLTTNWKCFASFIYATNLSRLLNDSNHIFYSNPLPCFEESIWMWWNAMQTINSCQLRSSKWHLLVSQFPFHDWYRTINKKISTIKNLSVQRQIGY